MCSGQDILIYPNNPFVLVTTRGMHAFQQAWLIFWTNACTTGISLTRTIRLAMSYLRRVGHNNGVKASEKVAAFFDECCHILTLRKLAQVLAWSYGWWITSTSAYFPSTKLFISRNSSVTTCLRGCPRDGSVTKKLLPRSPSSTILSSTTVKLPMPALVGRVAEQNYTRKHKVF